MRLPSSVATALALVSLLLAAAELRAQASSYVSLLDPAYGDVDALVGAGLVRTSILGQRPWARADFARMVREARARAESGAPLARVPRVAEALERLEARFAREAGWLCDADGDCPEVRPALRVTEVRVDGTWAESEGRAMPTVYAEGSRIDATLDPLLQRNGGRVLVHGWTGSAEAAVEAQLGRGLTVVARPRGWTVSPDGGESETDGTAQELYVRGVAGNLSVEAGRIHALEGQGREAGAILSANPRGLDMVRLSSAAPFRLPWIFRGLGPTEMSVFIADMGDDRDIPGSKLIVMRGSFRPHPNFEFGGQLLNHQGGEGGPEASFGERLADLFPVWEFFGKEISDKMVGLDFRLTLPDPGIDAYLEWANTDFNLNLNRFHEMLGDEAVWVGGVRFNRLGPGGRTTLWLEGHRSGVRPFTHHQFTSGLTLDERVIGLPAGPQVRGLTGGVDWAGTTHRVSVSGGIHRYLGDEYRGNGLSSGDFRWDVVSDNPDETRLRAELEWSRMDGAAGFRPWVRAGVERVTTFDFVEGEDRTNAMVQVGFSWLD